MKRIKSYAYIVIFLFSIFGLGIPSCRKLVHFYVNQEQDYNDWIPVLGNKFETDVASTFYEKVGFVNLNGAICNMLKQPQMNNIYKLKNNHLIIPQERIANEELEAYANEVVKFANYYKNNGKLFLFVQPILKVDADNKQLPAGVEDYSNENIDYYLDCLRRSGVDILDIRKCMKEDGMDMYDYTYVTDHHWTTKGGFYAFLKITEWIEDQTGITADHRVTDPAQYDITTYPKWHLGSYGQRTGIYYAGIDDYDLITPNYDVSFIDSNGNRFSFYEQAVNPDIFELRDVTSRYTYDRALKCPGGTASTSQKLSLLFVTDSYAAAMVPYIKLAYSDYDSLSYTNGFDSSYITRSDPDIIILMPFNTSAFSENAVFY